MDRILKILKKENGPKASSAPALELNTIIFKHVYWYMQQISGERLQDHWSSGFFSTENFQFLQLKKNLYITWACFRNEFKSLKIAIYCMRFKPYPVS